MKHYRFSHSSTWTLLSAFAMLSLGFVLVGCDSSGDEEPEVQEVIIVGTQVEQDFLNTGEYGLSATPLDIDGNSILNEDLEAEATLETANGQSVEANLDVTVDVSGVNTPSDDPLAVSVNIDGSGSMSSNDPNDARIDGARSFVDVVNNRAQDWEVAMFTYEGNPNMGFNDVELLQDFTDDVNDLQTSVNDVESFGGTPTYESLSEILVYSEDQRPANSYRKGIVLLSDGQPGSLSLKDSVCADAQRKDSPIYSIGLGPASDLSPNPSTSAVDEMRSIANCTNGAYAGIDPDSIASSTRVIYNNIATATSLGNVTFRVTLTDDDQLASLSPGQRLNGTLTINSGGNSATGSYSFTVPNPASSAASSTVLADPNE